MKNSASPLEPMLRKLRTRATLDDSDAAAVLDLPYILRAYEPSTYIVREGEPPRANCTFLQSGFAYRQKLAANGARQIVSLHLPGDFIDLQGLFLSISDHNVQALTRVEAVCVERAALQALCLASPNVAKALWVDALVDASVYREWVLNVGRRDARSRIAHVLCEFALRAEHAGIGSKERFELPMTQEQLADVVGLTSVHVNRTLKALSAEGVIHRDKRYIGFSNWEDVRAVADFSSLYLHMDQTRGS